MKTFYLYKNHYYVLVGIGINKTNDERAIIYRDIYGDYFTRESNDFYSKFAEVLPPLYIMVKFNYLK